MHIASKVTFWRAQSSKGTVTLQVHLRDFAEQPATNRQHGGGGGGGGGGGERWRGISTVALSTSERQAVQHTVCSLNNTSSAT